jgi:hypothetical protein
MKTLKLFLLRVVESFEFAWQVIRYALIFASAFFRQRASLGCERPKEMNDQFGIGSLIRGELVICHSDCCPRG